MNLFNFDTMKFEGSDEKLIALAASAAAYAVETDEGVIPETLDEVTSGSEFIIPLLIPEEVESGDGRKMQKDALTTRDLPIPLLWQIQTGDGHNGSVIVGRIDTIERVENGLGDARGVFDAGPYGREAERLVSAKMLRGVSADLDQFEATVDGKEMAGENFQDEMDKITSEKITVNSARVMAATLVPKPAFQECVIELVTDELEEENQPMPDGIYEETPPTADTAEFALSAIAASAAPVNPPSEWFNDPQLDKATPLTVDDDGRVYGHIASWETDHIGNYGVKPPRSRSNYAYFRTGLIRTEEGEDVAVGQLTLAGGHAGLDVDARKAVKHYDDTASAVADVACGEDQFGIWVAGGLRPGVTAEQVRTLRASAPSGDWRPINNTLELVAVCQVNVPGFPIARARVASGQVTALVAAGAATLYAIRNSEMETLTAKVSDLERMILSQKKTELSARVEVLRQERLNRLREAASQARASLAPELEKRAQLAARAAEIRAEFKSLHVDKNPLWDETKHPRDDEGKFRKVLAKLTDLLNGPDSVPGGDEAKRDLERAADLEDSGDMEGAKKAAGDAADKIENAADTADRGAGDVDIDAPEGEGREKARLGDRLHEIAEEVAVVVGDTAGEVAEEIGEKVTEMPNEEVPEEFRALLEHIIDELGEGVDPQTIVSRMDDRLRHWLEGKGFQSPEQLAQLVEKLLQRPVQPGIMQ